MNQYFIKIFDFILFASLFVSGCAIAMVYQAYTLIVYKPVNIYFAAFVFFSTICSYNFHWFLTPHSVSPSQRLKWDLKHKSYHLLLSLIGLAGSVVFFFFLKQHWFFISIAILLTFLYTAPKISIPPFQLLKKIAVGKTIFLAMTWTYVTTVLPVLIEGQRFTQKEILFSLSEFSFIYAVCILFDFRDREDDKANGIRSMITYCNEKGIDILFALSLIVFFILCFILLLTSMPLINFFLLIIPAIILAFIYKYAKRNFSDYLYYFLLDGLVMLSGLLLWLVNLF